MAGQKHEFGIMEKAPLSGVRYDAYEPWKYNCIEVHDDDLMELAPQYNRIDMYWHTLDVPGKGLAYYGVTLIPPEAAGEMDAVIPKDPRFHTIKELLSAAWTEGKFIIHFGI